MADFDHRTLVGNALPLIAVVLMASGIVVKTLPLSSKRPVESSNAKIVHAGRQDVHARLWEDPFIVMRDVEGKEPAKRCEEAGKDTAHHPGTLTRAVERALRQDQTVVVMPVFVPGGPYSQDSESRRRTRYATAMALLQAGWEPSDEEKLGFAWTFESCLDAHWTRLMPEIVAYEWFGRDSNEQSESVLVLWIDEDAVSRRPLRGMHTLNDLILHGPEMCQLSDARAQPPDRIAERRRESFRRHFETHCDPAGNALWRAGNPQPWTSTVVIGPWSSTSLFGLVREIARRAHDPALQGGPDGSAGPAVSSQPPEPRFYSSAATAPVADDTFERALSACERDQRAAAARGGAGGSNRVECAADVGEIADEFERRVVRLNATDDRLTGSLIDELMLRLNSATPLTHPSRIICEGTIVIVAEGDTQYSRTFGGDFGRSLDVERCRDRKGPAIVQIDYLRGLDGIAPGTAGLPANPRTAPKSPSPGARDALLEQAALERADGPSQFDYLRRLSTQLLELHRALRKDGQYGIAAVGILGSDAYDKILVLDALRDRFPDAVFFAADLDARMLDAGSVRSTRNLVVASGYGLALNRQLQGGAPPFRDTYQTGTYLSTLVALDSEARTLSSRDFAPWFQQPRRYEIGRTRPVNLVGAPDDRPRRSRQPRPDDCAKPNPATCRSIHYDGDWRDFDPWPAPRTWLALLVMAATTAGLAYVLSRKARSIGRELRRYATPTGLGVVVAGLAVLVAGLYAVQLDVRTRDGEPFAWLEGVSIWPTQILGLIILAVTCILLVYGRMRLRANIDKVAASFGLSTLGAHEQLSGRRERLVLKPDSTTHWAGEREAYRSGFRGRTLADEWMDFLGRMRFGACVTRVALATLLFLAFGIALLSLDWPNSPHRGAWAAWFNHALQFVLIGTAMALLFAALDASIVASRLLRRMLSATVDPELLRSRRQGTTWDYPIDEPARGQWVRFRLAVEIAAAVNRLIYLPFVVLLLLAPIRSKVFDAWDFSLPYAALLVISLVIAVRCALDLRKQAERLRTDVLKELEHEAERLENQARPNAPGAATGGSAGEVPASSAAPKLHATLLRRLAAEIRAVREGPFRPFSQEPVVRGLLMVLGGTGGITTAEFLFLAR